MLSHVMKRDPEGHTVPGPDPNVLLLTPCAFITKEGTQALAISARIAASSAVYLNNKS
jgi:hypothetical protein